MHIADLEKTLKYSMVYLAVFAGFVFGGGGVGEWGVVCVNQRPSPRHKSFPVIGNIH